ncbi:hypothetical protein AAHA92_33168 [Salvia divinorum]|uniref:Uncharacterized protein n=1 Tax=Salvia divinorum TaxID=28513 RepID=A0ABD1FN42_SALDI
MEETSYAHLCQLMGLGTNLETRLATLSECPPVILHPPGSVKISAGETLTLVSNYSSAQRHTGVMGLFYILIADSSLKPAASFQHSPAQVHMNTMTSYLGWPIALFGVGLILALVLIIYNGRNGYEERNITERVLLLHLVNPSPKYCIGTPECLI